MLMGVPITFQKICGMREYILLAMQNWENRKEP